jgi:LacI family transcriptional regulator
MAKQYATLKDVAKKANTTAATVSYVLNAPQTRYGSKEMRARVLAAAKALNYVKSSAASSLRGKNRKMLAVLVPQFSNQFFTQIVLGIDHIADEYGYMLSICNTFDDVDRELEIIHKMQQQRMDGYIIIPTKNGAQNTRRLYEMKIPLVMVDRIMEEIEDYHWVTTENYQCAWAGIEYLLKKGHRKIAFVGWDSGIEDLKNREKAYFDALQSYLVPKSSFLVKNGPVMETAGYELTKEILRSHPKHTAIFYAYNLQAIGGIRCLREHHKIPGKDISIVLIGTPDWAVIENFTRVDQKPYELGILAAKQIFSIIQQKPTNLPRHIMQNCALIEGNSVMDIN